MKKLLFVPTVVIILSLLPHLANAAMLKNIFLEKSVDMSFVAGSTQSIIVSFDNDDDHNQTFIFELAIQSVSSDYPVWNGDFDVSGILQSTSISGAEKNHTLHCFEKFNGTFWCNDGAGGIILQESHNVLTLYIDSKPNIFPTTYTFDFKMYVEPGIEKKFVHTEVNVSSGKIKTIDMKNETNVTVDMMTSQNVTGHVNVTAYEPLIIEPAFGVIGLNEYFDVEVNQELKSVLDWVMIKIFYTDEWVSTAGIDESTLRIWYYNTTIREWIKESDSGVDTANNYVWANISHFSLYAAYGNMIPTTLPVSPQPVSWDVAHGHGVLVKSMDITAKESVEIVQGEAEDVEVSVENNGNVKLLEVSITLSGINSDWFSSVGLGDLSTGEIKKTNIRISVPRTAEAKNYQAKIIATDAQGYGVSEDILIVVKEKIVPTTLPEEAPEEVPKKIPEVAPVSTPSPLTALIATATSPIGIAVVSLLIFINLLVAYKILSRVK